MHALPELSAPPEDLSAALRAATARAHAAERHLGDLAQLVAMLTEIHTANDAASVCSTIKETVANLVGCEQMGIYRAVNPGPILTLVDEIGLDHTMFGTLPVTLPSVAVALGRRLSSIPEGDQIDDRHHGLPISACVTLRTRGRVFGMIVLFRLLVQKPFLEPSDRLLLSLLGEHASIALYRHLDLETWDGLVA